MAQDSEKSALRVVLFADLEGYSSAVDRQELQTIEFMEACFAVFRSRAADFDGELIKTTGDGAVVSFESAAAAIDYAMRVHDDAARIREDYPGLATPRFRIGIHLGEVYRRGADIYGHAVNVAARLESIAPRGGVTISQDVYSAGHRSTPFVFRARGAQYLKNIPEPIALYDVLPAGSAVSDAAEDPAAGALRLDVIDGLTLRDPGTGRVTIRNRGLQGILGYLALSRNLSESRNRLAKIIWPDLELTTALRNLSRTLSTARRDKTAGIGQVIEGHDGTVRLIEDRVEIDLQAIMSAVETGHVSDLIVERSDWPEAILLGLEDVSTLFRSWLSVTRHNWRLRMLEALEAALERFELRDAALRQAATALLALEPSHEVAIQYLMRHYAETGKVGLAIRAYREFTDRLDALHGIGPSPATAQVLAEIEARGAPAPAPPPSPKPLGHRPTIGLGTFDAPADRPDVAHLVDGFRTELIANLTRFREWVVVETEGETDTHGESPTYLLNARASITDGHVAIIVIASDPGEKRIIWSDTYDASVTRWHEAQRQLVRRIAAYVDVYLSSDRVSRAIIDAPDRGSIHDDWLRSERLLTFWDPASEDQAAEILAGIIERKPDFAPAYASLASIHNVQHLIRPGKRLDAVAERRAVMFGQKAVELDPLDARNHLTLAWTLAMAGEHEQSALHYEMGLSLNANSTRSLLSCAQGLAFVGETARAAELLAEAIDLSPSFQPYQWCYVASTEYCLDRFEEAEIAARRGGDTTIDNPGWQAAALMRLGRPEEAEAAFRRGLELVGEAWCGDDPLTPARYTDWFVGSFPLGREEVRATIRADLDMLAAG